MTLSWSRTSIARIGVGAARALAVAVCLARTEVMADPATPARRTLESRLAAAALSEGRLTASDPTALVVGRPRAAGNGRSLVSFTLRYAGLSNRYCRLALLGAGSEDVRLVPLPAAALHDQCKRLSPVLWIDVNDDGVVDVIHGVRIPSNVGRFEVMEALVYVSTKDEATGHCYSAAASAALAPADLSSASKARAALQQAVRRLGASALACS